MSKTLMISTQNYPMVDSRTTDEAYLNERYQYLADHGIQAIDWGDDMEEDFAKIKKGEVNYFWLKDMDELLTIFTPTKNAVHGSGIAFSQMHALFPVYVEGNDELNEYLVMAVEKTLAIAAFMDCPAVVVHPYSCPDKEKEIAINLSIYRRLIPAAKEHGVTVCLENLFETWNGLAREGACSNVDEACWYIDKLNEEAGADVFGFCLDIGHATLLGRNLKHFILKLGKRLTCLHIHDNDGSHDTHAMPFTHSVGWGSKPSTDWDGMLSGLREIGYRGNLSFEACKSFLLFPKELESSLLTLYAAIGGYFRDKILNG